MAKKASSSLVMNPLISKINVQYSDPNHILPFGAKLIPCLPHANVKRKDHQNFAQITRRLTSIKKNLQTELDKAILGQLAKIELSSSDGDTEGEECDIDRLENRGDNQKNCQLEKSGQEKNRSTEEKLRRLDKHKKTEFQKKRKIMRGRRKVNDINDTESSASAREGGRCRSFSVHRKNKKIKINKKEILQKKCMQHESKCDSNEAKGQCDKKNQIMVQSRHNTQGQKQNGEEIKSSNGEEKTDLKEENDLKKEVIDKNQKAAEENKLKGKSELSKTQSWQVSNERCTIFKEELNNGMFLRIRNVNKSKSKTSFRSLKALKHGNAIVSKNDMKKERGGIPCSKSFIVSEGSRGEKKQTVKNSISSKSEDLNAKTQAKDERTAKSEFESRSYLFNGRLVNMREPSEAKIKTSKKAETTIQGTVLDRRKKLLRKGETKYEESKCSSIEDQVHCNRRKVKIGQYIIKKGKIFALGDKIEHKVVNATNKSINTVETSSNFSKRKEADQTKCKVKVSKTASPNVENLKSDIENCTKNETKYVKSEIGDGENNSSARNENKDDAIKINTTPKHTNKTDLSVKPPKIVAKVPNEKQSEHGSRSSSVKKRSKSVKRRIDADNCGKKRLINAKVMPLFETKKQSGNEKQESSNNGKTQIGTTNKSTHTGQDEFFEQMLSKLCGEKVKWKLGSYKNEDKQRMECIRNQLIDNIDSKLDDLEVLGKSEVKVVSSPEIITENSFNKKVCEIRYGTPINVNQIIDEVNTCSSSDDDYATSKHSNNNNSMVSTDSNEGSMINISNLFDQNALITSPQAKENDTYDPFIPDAVIDFLAAFSSHKNDEKFEFILTKTRFEQLKEIVENAVLEHRTFSVRGNWPSIQSSLLKRNWIEKYENTRPKSYNLENIKDLASNMPPKQENESMVSYIEKCERIIMSRLLHLHEVDFFWSQMKDNLEKPFYSNYTTIINRFKPAVFTSKEGLALLLQELYWFFEPGISYVNFPRCYVLGFPDHYHDFLDDFKLTACMGMLKWFTVNYDLKNPKFISPCGAISLNNIQFAIDQCNVYIAGRKHLDIDNNFMKPSLFEWDEFLENYYALVEKKSVFEFSRPFDMNFLYSSAKLALREISRFWPQYHLDGMKNIWVVKPGNECQGKGIHLIQRVEKIKNIVQAKMRYVVQKYIEEPFLIYNTKFDIRQWFVITSSQPLVIYMYRDSYLRFSSQHYNLDNFHESFHLTNHAIQCKYQNDKERNKALPDENMWNSHTFKEFLKQIGHGDKWDGVIYPGMKECIIGSMLACQETMDRRPNAFAIYGADFILAPDFKPWLLEINSNPNLQPSTSITAEMTPEFLEDIIKVVVDQRKDVTATTGLLDLVYKQVNTKHVENANLKIRGKSFKNPHVETHYLHKNAYIHRNALPPKYKNAIVKPKIYKGPIIHDLIEELSSFRDGFDTSLGVQFASPVKLRQKISI